MISGLITILLILSFCTSKAEIHSTRTFKFLQKEIDSLNYDVFDLDGQKDAQLCVADGVNSKEFKTSFKKKTMAWTTVTAFYGAIGYWSYFAWYKGQQHNSFCFEDEGTFGNNTYAGGSDKLGHMYSNYLMNRVSSQLLINGDFSKKTATIASTTLTMLFFTGIELKDGVHASYGFSWGDMVANICGNVLAAVMLYFPTVDDMFDFRLEYFPSGPYRKALANGDTNAGEDYSGMTFDLWYHLDSSPHIRFNNNEYIRLLRYIDVGIGWHTEHYKPEVHTGVSKRRKLSVGISLNIPLGLDYVFGENAKMFRRGAKGVLEYFTIPGTAKRVSVNLN